MKSVLYILHPGMVRSRNDGDLHYIDAASLAQLYGVQLRDCVVHLYNEPLRLRGLDQEDLVHLYPRNDVSCKLERPTMNTEKGFVK